VFGRFLFSGIYSYEGAPPGYRASVRYQYSVNGVVYESTRIRFGGPNPFSYHMVASEISRVEQKPGVVQVFYDARNPARACLITGPNEWTWVAPIILLSVGVAMFFLALSASSA
jgi:hypothetical protein